MDTNVTALKALYVALGGSAATVVNISTIAEMISAIASVIAEGSLAVLPTVDAEDNGKILTVVEGAWAAASAPVELPAVTSDDNGDVLTVVSGAWAKATP